MENKINISELIDYLYGDLTQLEKEAFEEKLRSNPDLRKEFEELSAARKGLSSMEDREIMDPFVFQAGYKNSLVNKTINRPRYMAARYMVAIAASLAIFFLAGYLTRATISFDDGSTRFSFGNSHSPEKPLSREEITGLIRNEVAGNNQALAGQLKASEASFRQVLNEHARMQEAEIRKLITSYTTAKNEEIDVFLAQLQKDNRNLVNEYMEQASARQQAYVQNLLVSFSDYLQQQRNQDLQRIQSSLVTLKESQDQQKLRTSEILTSIITTMNTQNN
ncbi:MAG TPA: hypothetical protein VI583_10905 [Cyclobacteriaceae bacterium]|nr:hypothetical protein [Cyclobacteriaceae bacterium]